MRSTSEEGLENAWKCMNMNMNMYCLVVQWCFFGDYVILSIVYKV